MVSGIGSWWLLAKGPVRSYFTRPRRTSSMAMMVGFFDDVGNTGRAPPCNCRARLAATMMKRYVLCSGSSGSVQWALLRGGLFSAIRQFLKFEMYPKWAGSGLRFWFAGRARREQSHSAWLRPPPVPG